jgi:hypothetical protein
MFRLMKRTGKKISFNFLSLLFPHLYFANRKMWGLALISMTVRVLLGFPSMIELFSETYDILIPWADISTQTFQIVSQLCKGLLVIFTLLWGLGANYFYYRFTQRKAGRIRKTAGTKEELYSRLRSEGGTSLANVLLICLQQLCFEGVLIVIIMCVR